MHNMALLQQCSLCDQILGVGSFSTCRVCTERARVRCQNHQSEVHTKFNVPSVTFNLFQYEFVEQCLPYDYIHVYALRLSQHMIVTYSKSAKLHAVFIWVTSSLNELRLYIIRRLLKVSTWVFDLLICLLPRTYCSPLERTQGGGLWVSLL